MYDYVENTKSRVMIKSRDEEALKEMGQLEHRRTARDIGWQRCLPTQTKVIIKIIKVFRDRSLVGMDDGSRNVPAASFGTDDRRLITFDDYALICT